MKFADAFDRDERYVGCEYSGVCGPMGCSHRCPGGNLYWLSGAPETGLGLGGGGGEEALEVGAFGEGSKLPEGGVEKEERDRARCPCEEHPC